MVQIWRLCLPLLCFISVGKTQSTTLDVEKFINALDTDRDKNITISEVAAVFQRRFGSAPANRCTFSDWLVGGFSGSPLRVSVMFDLIQSNESMVGAGEFISRFFGTTDVTAFSVSTFNASIIQLDNRITAIIAKPADYPDGSLSTSFWPYSVFNVTGWANTYDYDQNGMMSRLEVSAAMRGLDTSGDWNIERCEFVHSQTSYKQHSVTASKVYDVIFVDRDLTWADVDSDFLMEMMGSRGVGFVSKTRFIEFFTMQNALAAGLAVYEDGSIGDGNWAGKLQAGAMVVGCMTTSIIALFIIHL